MEAMEAGHLRASYAEPEDFSSHASSAHSLWKCVPYVKLFTEKRDSFLNHTSGRHANSGRAKNGDVAFPANPGFPNGPAAMSASSSEISMFLERPRKDLP